MIKGGVCKFDCWKGLVEGARSRTDSDCDHFYYDLEQSKSGGKNGKGGKKAANTDKIVKRKEYPSFCPACEAEAFPRSPLAPFYKHGSGVQKVNQLMADTLHYSLATRDKQENLILFSDSRQGAAKLSAGIEWKGSL